MFKNDFTLKNLLDKDLLIKEQNVMTSRTSSDTISAYLDKGYVKSRRRPNYHSHRERLSFLSKNDQKRHGKTKTKSLHNNRLLKQTHTLSKKRAMKMRREIMDEFFKDHRMYDFLDEQMQVTKEWYCAFLLEINYLERQ